MHRNLGSFKLELIDNEFCLGQLAVKTCRAEVTLSRVLGNDNDITGNLPSVVVSIMLLKLM